MLLPRFPGVCLGTGGGQGLQHQHKALLLFLCLSVMTDALWGRKKIFTLVCEALVCAVPPFRYPLPKLCEHLRVPSGCGTIVFWETTEKKNVYLIYRNLHV